ncbi:MAG: hypothetical protein EOP79_00925 [Variovorax sp.]|nr:MAG: hypothetical protein EOP79_00925 [Variovorax sp.]
MRNLHRHLVALCLLALTTAAQAACESGLAERMHSRLYPDRALDEQLAACKPWPAFPGRIVVVLPMPRPSDDPATKAYDIEVLLVQRPDNGNSERDTVIGRLFQPSALEEDVAAIQDILIDTSRYVLAADARAFGLRVRYRSATRGNPFASETLRLYMLQGAKLREVLEEIELDSDSGAWNADCTGRFRQLRTMLSTQPNRGGVADLVLARTRTASQGQWQDDGSCAEKSQPTQYNTVVLRYDGERFRVPKALRAP